MSTHTRAERLRGAFGEAGQAHLFDDWAGLSPGQRALLLEELEELDLALVARLAGLVREGSSEGVASGAIEPPQVFPRERDDALEARARQAVQAGEALLLAGKVGYVLVAGGQASRLGFDGPKGMLAIGPLSGWSLFEIHARRLLAARRKYGVATPWYVMTSRANDASTRAFFEEQRWFGHPREDVFFFPQAMVPAMDERGCILRSARERLFLAPNGHGGVLAALADSGALADARRRGVDELSYFQVDNPLARPADPLFLGLHALERAGMSSKVVEKRDAAEKVGVLARVGGRMACIEYSDLAPELREARDEHGRLVFRAGNIAIHLLRREFVEELTHGGLSLPWHLARKSMTVYEDGALVQRQGVKFETFVFDALQRSPRSVVLEVDRREEFSPVKNRSGADSPESARADLCRLHASWVRAAGLALPEPGPDGVHPVEVDPLVAGDLEEFLRRGAIRPVVTANGHFYRDDARP